MRQKVVVVNLDPFSINYVLKKLKFQLKNPTMLSRAKALYEQLYEALS